MSGGGGGGGGGKLLNLFLANTENIAAKSLNGVPGERGGLSSIEKVVGAQIEEGRCCRRGCRMASFYGCM